METDPTEGGQKSRLFHLYSKEVFSELNDISPRMREKIAGAFVHALDYLQVVKELRQSEDDMAIVFSSASSGRNEQLILEQLDPMLDGKKAGHIYALLTDMAQKSLTPTGSKVGPHFKNIIPQELQIDSLHLDALAKDSHKTRYLALCERLGALWHAARIDDQRRIHIEVNDYAATSALLSSYRALLGSGGVLIIDANETTEVAESTWAHMRRTLGGSEDALTKFLVDTFGCKITRLPSSEGVELIAISFSKK